MSYQLNTNNVSLPLKEQNFLIAKSFLRRQEINFAIYLKLSNDPPSNKPFAFETFFSLPKKAKGRKNRKDETKKAKSARISISRFDMRFKT